MIISLDLDGTLLDSNISIPQSTMEFLNRLKQRGEIIVLNSGRGLSEVWGVTENAYFANYVISDTGAVIYDVEAKKIIKKMEISPEDGHSLFKATCNKCTTFKIFTEDNIYIYPYDFEEYGKIIKDNISHISIHLKTQKDVEKFINENKDKFPELKIFAMVDSFGKEKWLEIINKKAGKFNSLLELANILNIKTEEIISFGDAINDLEMIQNSGIGVAMKNAIPELRQSAKAVTEFSNDECGVERWLRKFYKDEERV